MNDNNVTIASVIASGHSFHDHKQEFSDPALGREIDITNKNGQAAQSGLARYIIEAMQSDSARVFTASGDKARNGHPTSYIYNTQDNTLLILDANHSKDFGTIFRPNSGNTKFERLRENAGSPPIKKGAKAVQHAIAVFENAIFKKNPEALRTLKQMAERIQVPVHEPKTLVEAHKQAGKPKRPAMSSLLAEAAKKPRPEPDKPEDYIQDEVADILSDEDTLGFWADKEARVTHYMNEKRKTVVTLFPSGQKMHSFNKTHDFYEFLDQKIEESARARGEEPELISGGHAALSAQYKETMGKPPRVGSNLSEIGKQLRRAAHNGCTGQFNQSGQRGDSRITLAQPMAPGIMSFIKGRKHAGEASREYADKGLVPG